MSAFISHYLVEIEDMKEMNKNPLHRVLSPAALNTPLSLPDFKLNPAKWTYERLVKSIASFEEGLDHEHEVGARLVTFGANFTFQIDNIGYWGPDIVKFHGRDENGKEIELIQHVSQLSVLLIAVDKTTEEPRRIGFKLLEGIEGDED